MKIISLVGARPQFVKEALVGEAARKNGTWEHILVHSGQHYDSVMSDVFFQELGIPEPKYHLGIGSGTHGAMTGAALAAVEKVLMDERPDALLVYGDTNTTLAGALAAAKLGMPVVHVEAGIRMLPKTMPEEINRVLTDRISTVMCCCSCLGVDNLAKEGIQEGVFMTGDVMYDLFLRMRPRLKPEETCSAMNLPPNKFIVATLHRDYNVDSTENLGDCLLGLNRLSLETGLQVVLPIHPRTRKNINKFQLEKQIGKIRIIEPVGYFELMSMVQAAAMVVTDSGGLQKEAYYAGKRSLVIMPDTGWRELTDTGWNLLSAPDSDMIVWQGLKVLNSLAYPANLYGDGFAARRIVESVLRELV